MSLASVYFSIGAHASLKKDLFCEPQMLQERRWRKFLISSSTNNGGGTVDNEGLIQDVVFDGSVHVFRWHFRSLGKGMHEFLEWC